MSGRRASEERITGLLRGVREKGTEAVYCVVGAGNGGLAMAGHLGILGYPVRLYNRTPERLAGVRWHGGIKVDGAVVKQSESSGAYVIAMCSGVVGE